MLSGDLCHWVEMDNFNAFCARGPAAGGPCIWISVVDVVSSRGTVVPCAWVVKPCGRVVRIPLESLRACLEPVIFSTRIVWMQRSTR